MDALAYFQQYGLVSEDVASQIKQILESQNISFESAALQAEVSPDLLRENLANFYEVPSYTVNPDQKIQEQVISYLFKMMRQKVEKEV